MLTVLRDKSNLLAIEKQPTCELKQQQKLAKLNTPENMLIFPYPNGFAIIAECAVIAEN